MSESEHAWPQVWQARWIRFEPPPPERGWYDPRPRPRDAFAYYRRAFDAAAPFGGARCRVTADGRYVLFVNGVRVGAGPVRSEPAHLTYDDYDLSALLRDGRNVIALLARHYGGPVVHYKPPPVYGDLGFGGVLLESAPDGNLGNLGTDASWRAMQAPYVSADLDWPEGPPAIEVFDGRAHPRGWTDASFDDSSWPQAIVVEPRGLGIIDPRPPAGPFGPLPPRPIAPLAERMREPASESLDAGVYRADFGLITAGHPILTVTAAAGTVIEVASGEDRSDDGRLIVAPRGWSMQYTAAGSGSETMEAFEQAGFRYAEARVRGDDSAVVHVTVRERTYPRGDGAGFRCSDPGLERIWAAGARTMDLCSLDAIVDCPGREQRAWLGDQSVTALASLMANPDPRLVLWTLRLHAQGARSDGLLPMVAAGDFTDRAATLPDFTLHWICAVRDVWLHTGVLPAELLPIAERGLSFFERYRGSDGLLANLPGWVFVDWAQTQRAANVAAVDALYALALDAFAQMADATDRPGPAAEARERAAVTRAAFGRYWDAERGIYVDAATPGGVPGRRVSQQTNAIAIVAGCAPPDRQGAMLTYVLDPERVVRTRTPGDAGSFIERIGRQWEAPRDFDDGRNVVEAQPFFAHMLHRAMMAAGRRDALLPSIRRWETMLARGNGCFEEYWDAEPGLGSRAHAWSATPVYDLPAYVLGVTPASAGFAAVRVEPYLGDLAWVEGSVPTPLGFIDVRATRDGGTVTLPGRMRGTLSWNGATMPLDGGVNSF